MCGIVGCASKYKLQLHKSWIQEGSDMIKHRGPDDEGYWSSEDHKVEFGHQRLAIMDTTELGAQPMLDHNLKISLIFNGEIYNFKELRRQLNELGYVFKSDCDTEIIIASYREWGQDCVSKFNGMFAIALYDFNSGDLFIARDRAGEKPLYYYLDNESISFASELKALLKNSKIKKEIDKSSLDCYLSFGFTPGKRCIYSCINKLEAGSYLVFNTKSGNLTSRKYWELPKLDINKTKLNKDKHNLMKLFSNLFEDSISKQLVADVPVGVLLSGGLDSSLVTAVASKYTDKLKTFNVRFPGFGKLDETKHARKIANHFGTEHIELDASDLNPDLLLDLARQFDEPIIDSSMLPTYLISKEVKKYCTVALGGDGADELFGGYSHYEGLLKVQKITRWVPFSIQKYLAMVFSSVFPEDYRGMNWLQSLNYNYSNETPLVASYFDSKRRKKLFGYDYLKKNISAERIYDGLCLEGLDLLDRAMRTDFKTYLAEDILVKVDRASMMNSLEIRAPFLDYRIVEFAFSKIPTNLKVSGSSKKIFLQNYASEILPKSFSYGRKQGFSIPLNHWLKKGPFRDFFYDTLLSSECIFEKTYINKILINNNKGRNNSEKIFGLVMFELWRKAYGSRF